MSNGEVIAIHLDSELNGVKEELLEMGSLVEAQLSKAYKAFTTLDKDLAREVILSERRVNAYELKIDRDCEHILALRSPIAADLRVVLAVLKINSNMERIGDIAAGIAYFVIDSEHAYNQQVLQTSRVLDMFDGAILMLSKVMQALDKEDATAARSVLGQDDALDVINKNALNVAADIIRKQPDMLEQSLNVFSIVRKLERVGDQVTNIAEEIIFFIEAKVLKHKTGFKKD